MTIKENRELAALYGQRIIDFMMGRRKMAGIKYSETREGIHLSDLQLCPLPAVYRHILPPEQIPPIDLTSALRFFRGRVFERAIGTEQPPMELDGITCTIDDEIIMDGVPEIKSTAEGMEWFRPDTKHPDWMERMKGYLNVMQMRVGHIIVFFLAGNMSDYLPWSMKMNKQRPDKYNGIGLKAWTMEFTDVEIRENWAEMLRRRGIIDNAIKFYGPETKEIIALPEVEERRPKWMCAGCVYRLIKCYAMVRK